MSDGFSNSPMLGPLMRAYQLYQMIIGTRNAAEDRKLGLEDRQRHIANETYARERQGRIDAQTQENQNRDDIAHILEKGGRQVQPGTPFFDLLKPQTLKIGADTYSVPDPQIAERRKADAALEKYRQEKTIDAEIANKSKPRFKLLPEVAEFLGKTEATEDEINSYVKQHNAANPNMHFVTNTDDAGNVSVTAINPRTFERVGTIPLGQVGKSKTQPKDDTRNVFKDIKEVEDAKSKAYTLQRKAQIYQDAGEIEKAEAARQEAETHLDQARRRAIQLKETYGDKIRVGNTDAGQWPYASPVAQSQASSPAAPAQASVFPASKLAALAKRRKKDVNAVRKELTNAGYQIDERN